MIVNGKAIAETIYSDVRERVLRSVRVPRLTIITCAPNFETQKYLALKKKKATAVGITTTIVHVAETADTETVRALVARAVSESDGIVVQLPLPAHIDTEAVLRAVPPTHDVDALNPATTAVLSPVVGAFRAVLEHHHVAVFQKLVTIIGAGRLVGLPAYVWFQGTGAAVSVVTKDTNDISPYTKSADIIVCGAGVPGLLTPSMIKEGVVILDGGTSEAGGELRGDADPACAEKAALFTPVPGGIGPITIAVLLQNLMVLFEKYHKSVV